MVFNPVLGYDPDAQNEAEESPPGLSPSNPEQWAHDIAIVYTDWFANGTAMPGWVTQAQFQQWGIAIPPQNARGSGVADQLTYNAFYNMAQYMATNYNSLPAEVKNTFVPPPVADPNKTPPLTDQQQHDIFTGTQNQLDRAQELAIQKMIEAGNLEGARIAAAAGIQQASISAGATVSSAQIRAAADKYIADLGAKVDRERLAEDKRQFDVGFGENVRQFDVSFAENQRQFNESIGEQRREFDLGLAEDRRQFNSTMLFELFDRGIQLAQNPVDWLGYQYYLQNLGAPINALTLGSAAAQMGAVPPTGPSAAGPLVGGPAVMDGDTGLAQQVGVPEGQEGFVPVSQAVERFGGGSATVHAPEAQAMAAKTTVPAMAEQVGGMERLDAMTQQAGAQELPAAGVKSPQLDRMQTQSVAPPAGDMMAGRTLNADGINTTDAAGNSTMIGAPPPLGEGADILNRGLQDPYASTTGMTAGAPNATTAGAFGRGTQPYTPDPNLTPEAGGGVQQPPAAGTEIPYGNDVQHMGAPGATPERGGGAGTATSGIYTGAAPPSEPAATSPQTGAATEAAGGSNPQGNQLLEALAAELGIPYSELVKVVPVELLAGGYTTEQIAQSQPVRALVEGWDRTKVYRTAPVGDSKFGQLQAFGIPMGIRGGQDVNAGVLVNGLDSTKQMIAGTISAMGQSPQDFQQQALRASPITGYNAGAFGRRRVA